MEHLSEQRLRKLWARQSPGKWGKDYEPGIQLTPREAPRTSRPSLVWSSLVGRNMHLMSQSEQIVAILAQYSKNVFEIHEQKILPTAPEQHPLSEYYRAVGEDVPVTRGTVAIAESLGCLRQHPVVYIDGDPVPYNYLGDFMIFCRDELGPYCIDITVKKSVDDFGRKHGEILRSGKKSEAASLREKNRHKIQDVLNQELGIKMVYVAGDSFDKKLRYNLTHLYKWHARETHLSDVERAYIIEELKECLVSGIPAIRIANAVCNEIGCAEYDFRTVYFQAIWRRELKPSLYSYLQIDAPMTPEIMSPVNEYAEFFTRLI